MFVKLIDRYTGWVGESVRKPQARKLFKRRANKHNRKFAKLILKQELPA